MRKPNHIILDFHKVAHQNPTQYWASSFLDRRSVQPAFIRNLNLDKKYIKNTLSTRFFVKTQKSEPSNLLKNPSKYTFQLSTTASADLHDLNKQSTLRDLVVADRSVIDKEVRTRLLRYTKDTPREKRAYLRLGAHNYSRRNLKKIFIFSWKSDLFERGRSSNYDQLSEAVNVNFLRKERMYTKLKYSRTPAYDIVSGGSAALLAGFIGFLVSEKFGFELVDSGDFYFFFMYIVFLTFSIRPLLMAANPEQGFVDLLSLRRVFEYYNSLFYVFVFNAKHR